MPDQHKNFAYSTAATRVFLLVSSTDHISALTAATPAVTISKAGAAFAAAAGAVSEIGNGWYKVAYTTADTATFGDLAAHVTATGADPTDFADQVVAFDPTDAVAFGLSRIDAAISSRMATFSLPTNFSLLSIDASGRVDHRRHNAELQLQRHRHALAEQQLNTPRLFFLRPRPLVTGGLCVPRERNPAP